MNGDLERLRQALVDGGVEVSELAQSVNNEFVWFYDPDDNRFETQPTAHRPYRRHSSRNRVSTC